MEYEKKIQYRKSLEHHEILFNVFKEKIQLISEPTMKFLLLVPFVLSLLGLFSTTCSSYTILGYDVDYIGDYISYVGSYFITKGIIDYVYIHV
jgi:hypothetical protein